MSDNATDAPQTPLGTGRTGPLTLWQGELAGVRVISLKNSKRLIRIAGAPRLVPSAAHDRFMAYAVPTLRRVAPDAPIAVPFALTLAFALKGRLPGDLDNLATAVIDLLMAAGIIADDALCVRLVAEKCGGAPDWHTAIRIAGVA